MKNFGKQFEKDFSSSIPSHCYVHRLRDTAQSYNSSKNTSFTWSNECDFFVFDGNSHLFYAIECKSTKYKNFSVQVNKDDDSSKMIKFHQIESLTNMSKYDGLIAGFCFNFRDEKNNCQRTYFQEISNFNRMMKEISKVSLNEMDLLLYNAIKINGEKKRVNYIWNMDEFFVNMNEKFGEVII
jgi:hypothetical protein